MSSRIQGSPEFSAVPSLRLHGPPVCCTSRPHGGFQAGRERKGGSKKVWHLSQKVNYFLETLADVSLAILRNRYLLFGNSCSEQNEVFVSKKKGVIDRYQRSKKWK